ncbi:MAG: hemolysin D [Terrimicrobiaceae bacterium]
MAAVAQQLDPGSLAPAPLRGDLVEREQRYLGRTYVVYKNTLSLGYFRLPTSHAMAARAFDGRTRIRDILPSLRQRSSYWKAVPPEQGIAELATLAQQLGAAGLLRVQAAGAIERGRRARELKKKHRFESAVGHALFFKKSIYDPDRLLDRWMPYVRWIYSPVTLTLCGLFMLSSLLLAIRRWDDITALGANFFTLHNLGLTWVLFIGVKIVHEFGHAFTAKRHGAEVHEMGFMFILFTPYLYCNVTDSWLADKRARIAVTAAGIVVELFLAAVATWLWAFSQPGLFHQMCFNAMVLASVSTVIFNANPLMKFDGYYIMTDLLEIPNLRAKSNAWVTAWAQRVLLGMKNIPARIAGHEVGPFFGVYAVAAYAYGWFVVYNISIHLFNMLEPYGLQIVSRTYVALFLFVSLALPLYRLTRNLKGAQEFHRSGIPRLKLVGLSLLVVLALFFVIPWDATIKRMAALDHEQSVALSAPAPGFLREVAVTEGELVAAGQLLGRLENPELASQLEDFRLQKEAMMVRQRAAILDGSEEARLTVPVFQKMVDEADEQIAAYQKKLANMDLITPVSGTVRTKRPGDLVGRFFAAGQPVFEVGHDKAPKLIIVLNEKQARRVQAGQRVVARFAALPGQRFEGTIRAAPVARADQLTIHSLANIYGGDVPSEPDAHGTPKPSVPLFEAEATLDIDPESLSRLRAHSTGAAKIHIRQTTLGLWLWENIVDLIDPSVRL